MSLFSIPHLPAEATNLTTTATQEEIFARMAAASRLTAPDIYANGIINYGTGYYQLAHHDDMRVLVFALNLEDMQKCTSPTDTSCIWFNRPDNLFGVGVYDETATPDRIFTDMTTHQRDLRQAIREDYSLYWTGDNVLMSRAISYAVANAHAPLHAPHHQGGEHHHIHAFSDALQDREFSEIFTAEELNLYLRSRYTHTCLTRDNPVACGNERAHILEHFSTMVTNLSAGRDAMQAMDKLLTWPERKFLKAQIATAKAASHLIDYAREHCWPPREAIKTFFELFAIWKAPFELAENIPNFLGSLNEASELLPFGEEREKKDERFLELVEKPKYLSRLNLCLHRLRGQAVEQMRPLSAQQSRLVPINGQVIDADPFSATRYGDPSSGDFRTATGAMNRVCENSILTMQANGIWIADCNWQDGAFTDRYVGYNQQYDTNCKPNPSPLIAAWLQPEAGSQQGHVLHYKFDGHRHGGVQCVSLQHALENLQEIVGAGDSVDLRADVPKLPTMKGVVRNGWSEPPRDIFTL